jgi:acylphosphatase
MSDVRCRVIVSGRVQGVFFRDTCQRVASGLGVRGWVRNRPDGTVEVAAEGSREAVDALLDWCRDGPPRASVVAVEVHDEPLAADRDFRIRY